MSVCMRNVSDAAFATIVNGSMTKISMKIFLYNHAAVNRFVMNKNQNGKAPFIQPSLSAGWRKTNPPIINHNISLTFIQKNNFIRFK